MGIGARSAYVGLRKVKVMDCAVVNVEGHAVGDGYSSASGLHAQGSRSNGTGYD